MSQRQGPPLLPLLLVNFIGTLGFSIVMPFLVVLVTRLGGNALVYGLMGATYSAFQLVGAPVLGRWSDIRGRRRILLLSQLGTLASWVVFLGALALPRTPIATIDSDWLGGFVLTLPLVVLFAARALDGLTGGNVSVANAYLADVTTPEQRKVSFGRMAVAANLGFIVGPMIGGALGSTRWGEAPPVLAALAISASAAWVIWRHLPESRPCAIDRDPEAINVRKVFGQEQADCYRREPAAPSGWRAVLGRRCVGYLLGLNFLLFVAFNLFYTAFPVHLLGGLRWGAADIGLFFSFLGLATVIVQGPLLQRLSERASDIGLVVAGGAILGAGFLLYPSPRTAMIYGGGFLFALGNGLMWPSFMALLSRYAGDQQGTVQGYSSSVGSAASILGLVGGGILYGLIGPATFRVAAALVFIVVVLAMRFTTPGEARS